MAVQDDCGLPAQYDRLTVGVALYDPETGLVMDANDRLESLVGYTTEQLRDLTIDEYSANTQAYAPERMQRWLREAAAGDSQQFKWGIKRADGELLWVRMHLSAYAESGQQRVLAEVSDITDHYIASRRVGLFSRLLRHNLRNGVSVVAGRAEHVQTVSDAPAVQDGAEKIRQKAMEIGRLTESVKEIEQATTRTVADRTHRSATDAVAAVVDTYRDRFPHADISVEERDPMWLHVDDAFDHALGHAVENAIVHNPDPEPSVAVTVGASPNTGRVEVRVVDAGPPIPDSELDALDEFAETTSTSHGSGTGLFVMKWCLESLGGELAFQRHADGNMVSLLLPPKAPPSTR